MDISDRLIEILIVTMILFIIAAIAIPNLVSSSWTVFAALFGLLLLIVIITGAVILANQLKRKG